MKEKFNVNGMSCAACVSAVEKKVSMLEGVESCSVSLTTNSMTASFDENITSRDDIIKAVFRAGYTASVWSADENAVTERLRAEEKALKKRIILSLLFMVMTTYVSMSGMFGLPLPSFLLGAENAVAYTVLLFALSIPVIWLNRAYYVSGFRHLVMRTPNMDTLIAIGSSSSLIYGLVNLIRMIVYHASGDLATLAVLRGDLYIEAAVMILTLVTLGKYVEGRSRKRTGDAVTALVNLAPKVALVIRDGEEILLPASEVKKGDMVVVKAGESISADGIIRTGECYVDESMLTGESKPVKKTVGLEVAGGTICSTGYAVIEVNKTGEETVLARIVSLVEEASSKKAPVARLADKIAGIFVPIVMGIALITLAVWWIAEGFSTAFSFAVSVLVISCPCALGLATPVSLTVGIGMCAKRGILTKSGEGLERASRVDIIVLDKTGTLTVGKPKVSEVIADGSADELLSVAYSVERFSEHPLAKAVTEHCAGVRTLDASDFETVPGRGVFARIDGEDVRVGNLAYVGETCDLSAYTERGEILASRGATVFAVSRGARALGLIAVSDEIRPESYEAIRELKKFAKVYMLTGDGKKVASYVCDELGIENFRAEVLPSEKEAFVTELKKEGRVMFVGDGINDAPALTSADLGVAIGAGTDVAIDSADVVLSGSNPLALVSLVRLGRATMRKVKQNLFWAFLYNSLGIPLAAGVLYPFFGVKLSPMIGSLAMSMSSICVVMNALSLKLFRDKKTVKNEKGECEMNVEIVKVDGMMCSHCTGRVEKVVSALGYGAVADLERKQVTVSAEGKIDLESVKKAITDAGYDVID